MPESTLAPGPIFSPERFAERLAEAIRLAGDPAAFARLPPWTQRVMLILKEQLVPSEFTSVFGAEHAVLVEGVCVAWMPQARDTMADASAGDFATRVAEWLTRGPQTSRVVEQIRSGDMAQVPEFREHVMRRLFAASPVERRAFSEGLALGNRVHDLFLRQGEERSTDATRVYLLLWLYWPEIEQLHSLTEAAEWIERRLGVSRNLVGRNWEERFRKIANRIGLSYRAHQARRKKTAVASRAGARKR